MTPASYDLQTIRFPRLYGGTLRLVMALLDSPFRHLMMPKLLREAGVTWFRQQAFDEPPAFYPQLPWVAPSAQNAAAPRDEWPAAAESEDAGFRPVSVHDYARAYREKLTTPNEVAERVLTAAATSDRAMLPLRAFIALYRDDVLRQAEAATKRFRDGVPLSIFDGVPVAVKDELDMVPYPTTAGTSFLGHQPAKSDATVVARFRAAGALLIGKANMHEIGIGVTGMNPAHGTPRNPYAPQRHTGGSSSGSAAAVAAGLCPLAVAADGGGSIRIPAALCGVVGLKPTYGRVSEHGAVPLCWSVGHIGPIGATAADAGLGYAIMAGPDQKDPASIRQPSPSLAGCDCRDLRGVTLGVYWPWFRHADADVVEVCEALLERLREKGARIREVAIPNLEAARVAHVITICSEMAQATSAIHAQHHRKLSCDARMTLRIARALTARDYIQAQRARAQLTESFRHAFEHVDAIITPATATAAPLIVEAAQRTGISDLSTVAALMRFATPANLSGHPAIVFPAGYTPSGLPIGLQAMGRPWEEPLLLRIASVGESCLTRQAPRIHFRLAG